MDNNNPFTHYIEFCTPCIKIKNSLIIVHLFSKNSNLKGTKKQAVETQRKQEQYLDLLKKFVGKN